MPARAAASTTESTVPQASARWRWLTAVATLLFVALSMLPMPNRLMDDLWKFELGWDKAAHALWFWAYGLLAASGWSRANLRPSRLKPALLCFLPGILLGAFGEGLQFFLPWRQGLDLDDFLADIIGCLLAWASLPLWARFLPPVEALLARLLPRRPSRIH